MNARNAHHHVSLVTLIIMRNNRITVVQQHYRIIEKLLKEGLPPLHVIKNRSELRLDEGYIIYDANNKLIINAQYAFALPRTKGFETLTLF